MPNQFIFLGIVRTPDTNPCVRHDSSTDKMNSKTVISLEELSQIPAVAEISHSHEEYILAATKNLSSSLEILEGPKFPELQKDFFPIYKGS